MLQRLGLSVLLGAAMGLERELGGHRAGLRTHLMVAVGACLFAIASILGADGHQNADPTRIASQVVVGIGFLGGGAIIHERGSVRGLTTAAGLWVAASVGVAAGLGAGWLATLGALVALFCMAGLLPLERWLKLRLRIPSDDS